jgi:hypothetical protein
MAFPFADRTSLQQRLLAAIGGTSLLSAAAFGCTSKHTGGEPAPMTAGESMRAGNGAGGDAGRTNGPGAGKSGAGTGGSNTSPICKTGSTQRECYSRKEMEQKAAFGCGMIAPSPPLTAEEVQAKFGADGCLKRESACNSCCNPAQDQGLPQADGSCCYTFCSGVCCGRPFVVDGTPRLAHVVPRSDWLRNMAAATATGAASRELALRIAAEWREDARMEHASIASFARFTLDLLAFGAPAELIELTQRAALDEIEHTRLCFTLATRYDGREVGPAALPMEGVHTAASLWDAATSAFDEGCVGETLAAAFAHAARAGARDPEVVRVLERIADQEARHAELAWRFVAWCTTRLGSDLTHELTRRFEQQLTASAAPHLEPPEADPARATLSAAGRLTAAEKWQLTNAGLRDIVAPCVAQLRDLAAL